ncbi:MAG: DUF4160 domain-containing protein [Mogibacterium sp.]|nr:DUF4160 domain-containing protein [Mogibacterium sp.]
MPTISRFYGIVIRMYYLSAEHNPPHIHVIYGEDVAAVEIKTGQILDGDLPNKAMALVLEWIELHRDELMAMWETQEFHKISPLV